MAGHSASDVIKCRGAAALAGTGFRGSSKIQEPLSYARGSEREQSDESAGSTVNVVTKSGSNQFHGGLLEFVRNGDLKARNFFAQTSDTQKNVNFTVPGLGSAIPTSPLPETRWAQATSAKLTLAADPRILEFGLKFIF